MGDLQSEGRFFHRGWVRVDSTHTIVLLREGGTVIHTGTVVIITKIGVKTYRG